MITATAYAKLNLSLHITGRRDDGYHLLDSITIFTEWGDQLTLSPSSHFHMDAEGPYAHLFQDELACTKHHSPNLIARATHMMAAKAQCDPDIHIHLVKNIPAGAGLGGASADAAAIMHLLNGYWSLGLSIQELCELGIQLGADVPVCLHARAARVRGIGEGIERVSVPAMPLVIAWPEQGLATQDVFARYHDSALPFSNMSSFLSDLPFDQWLESANNDLTAVAVELCPSVAETLSALQDCGGIKIARMTGSGSACFGIFETEAQAKCAAATFPNAIATKILT